MKKIMRLMWVLPLLLFCTLPLQGRAWQWEDDREANTDMQKDKVERIIEKYSNSKYVECVQISPKLLAKLSGAKNTDNLVKNISGLNILSLSKKDSDSRRVCEAFMGEIKEAIKSGYSDLLNIKSNGERVNIYIEDKNSQVVMLIESDDEFSVLNIDGSITNEIIKAVMSGEIKIK